MRVAQRMVTRNYMKQLNSALGSRAGSLKKQASGLKFSKLSENVSDGVRAMRIQEERTAAERQMTTVEATLLEFNSVDSNTKSIDDILQSAQDKVQKAMNDPNGETARAVLAQEIGSLKSQLLQFCNAQFGGKYLFSGTNNATPPFDVDSAGKVTFNGIRMEDIYRSTTDGKYYYDIPDPDPAALPGDVIAVEVPDSGDIYLDIGLGMRMPNGKPDPRTAFMASFSGLELLGYNGFATGEHHGTSVSNNVFDLLTDLETAVKSGSQGEMSDMHTQLVKLTDKMRMTRTELGSRVNFLERSKERLDNDIDNLSEMETNLISIDTAEEAINMKMYEYVWLAVLQLGAQILPTSLMDYLR